jgi:hypothetical protein
VIFFAVSLHDTVDFHSLMDVYLSCCSFECLILFVSCIYHLSYWYIGSAWNHAILHSLEFYPSLMTSHDHIMLIPSCHVVTVCCCVVDMYSSSSLISLSCLIGWMDSSSYSCCESHKETAAVLVSHGANIEAKSNVSQTAHHYHTHYIRWIDQWW